MNITENERIELQNDLNDMIKDVLDCFIEHFKLFSEKCLINCNNSLLCRKTHINLMNMRDG